MSAGSPAKVLAPVFLPPAGTWRARECLGYLQPLAGDLAMRADRGVVTVAPLGDDKAEVERGTAHAVGRMFWTPAPQVRVGSGKLHAHRVWRQIKAVRGEAEGHRADTDVRDMPQPGGRLAH